MSNAQIRFVDGNQTTQTSHYCSRLVGALSRFSPPFPAAKTQEQEESYTIGQKSGGLVFYWLLELPRHWRDKTARLLSLVWVRLFSNLHKITLKVKYREERKISSYNICVLVGQLRSQQGTYTKLTLADASQTGSGNILAQMPLIAQFLRPHKT